jgi:hypothetical protein
VNPVLTQILQYVGLMVSGGTAVWVARIAKSANDRKTKTEGEIGAGQLALNIANRADKKAERTSDRLDYLEGWRRRLADEWWPRHVYEYDRIIEGDLRRLDPGATIPPVIPMPEYAPPRLEDGDD